ncbi:hypothetical protein H4W33_002282 [Kibdelosporangium phytohabitans]|nr:hypothetical protein [Kibdelosporangium phytohabitans]
MEPRPISMAMRFRLAVGLPAHKRMGAPTLCESGAALGFLGFSASGFVAVRVGGVVGDLRAST